MENRLIINRDGAGGLCPNCCQIFNGRSWLDPYYDWPTPMHECMYCGHTFSSHPWFRVLVYIKLGGLENVS